VDNKQISLIINAKQEQYLQYSLQSLMVVVYSIHQYVVLTPKMRLLKLYTHSFNSDSLGEREFDGCYFVLFLHLVWRGQSGAVVQW